MKEIDKELVFTQLKTQKIANPPLYDRISCPTKGCPVYLNIRNQPLEDYRSIIERHVLKKHSKTT